MKPTFFDNEVFIHESQDIPESDRMRLRIFKLRRVVSWAWLVPWLIVICSLGHSFLTYVPPQHQTMHSHSASNNGGIEGSSVESPTKQQPEQRTANTPDYASDFRTAQEIFFPLVGILLTISLIAQEWKQGTIIQLALRRSLRKVFYQRLGIVCGYLFALSIICAAFTLLITIQPPDQGNIFQWLWDTLATVVPPTLLLLALALLVTHLTKSIVAGYIVAVSFWAVNNWFVLSLQIGKVLIPYTLFGWANRNLAVAPDNWVLGKLIWFMVALLLLLAQFPLLHNESRFIQNTGE
jgi:hypothetical protein